jgi:hypothetical protein
MAGRALAEVAFHLFSLKVGLFFAPVVSAHCLIWPVVFDDYVANCLLDVGVQPLQQRIRYESR